MWLCEVIGDIQTKWTQIRHDNGIFIGSKQMVYRISKKSKNFKKRLKEKKDAYKIMSMLRVHAYAGKCSHMVVTYFRIRD